MGRNKKRCHIGKYPNTGCFVSNSNYLGENNIELDELEAMRLVDLLSMSQIEAADKLGVSRGTVQRLLNKGRKKVVDALINGKNIILATDNEKEMIVSEEESNMNVAFIMQGNMIGGHFGHAKTFKIVELNDELEFVSEINFTPKVSGGNARAHWLYESNVSVLIASSCGEGAIAHLESRGIKAYNGKDHTIESALISLKDGTLEPLTGHSHHSRSECNCSED